MVFFYSQPLFLNLNSKVDLYHFYPIENNLNFDLEYSRLEQIIKENNKEFNIMKEPLNFESFRQIMLKEPKIVHISCHGDYDPNNN